MKARKARKTKIIASALSCASLNNEQAQKMYNAFFNLFKEEKVKLRVIKGGKYAK